MRRPSGTRELSGGLRQRAMIAMALSCDPRLLLADEPTTALDATVQIRVLILLRKIQRELGMGMIFVTHDLGACWARRGTPIPQDCWPPPCTASRASTTSTPHAAPADRLRLRAALLKPPRRLPRHGTGRALPGAAAWRPCIAVEDAVGYCAAKRAMSLRSGEKVMPS